MLHLAIINYLEANEKNYKISAKKQKQGKEPDGIKNAGKDKKKKSKNLTEWSHTGMENTEKRFSKPQDIEFTQIENHMHTHTHKNRPQRPGRQ